MGKLVSDHARNLLAAKHLEQPGGDRDRRVLRIASGRERVGLRIVHQIDARHRQAGAARQLVHQPHQVGGVVLVDLTGAVHRQHQLVGIPIAQKIHRGRDEQRDHGAALSADEVADTHEQGGEACQQNGGTEVIHCPSPWPEPGAHPRRRLALGRKCWVSAAPPQGRSRLLRHAGSRP